MGTYLHERYIERALDTLLAQDYPPEALEIIVVDDGSPDRTPEVVEPYLDRIRYIRKENAGLRDTVNVMLAAATGDYIAFFSGDDETPPSSVRRRVELLERRAEIGLCYGDMEVIDGDGNTIAPSFFAANGLTPRRGRALGDLLARNFVSGGAIMVRASLLSLFFPLPQEVAWEDWWIALRVAEHAEIDFLEEPVSRYRLHGNNLVGGAQGDKLANAIREEVNFRRYQLRTLNTWTVTVDDLLLAVGQLQHSANHVATHRGQSIEAVYDVSEDDRARASLLVVEALAEGDRNPEQGMRVAVRALGYDPTSPAMWGALKVLGEARTARIAAVAEVDALLVGVRERATLAFAGEVMAAPQMLASYAAAVGPGDSATLVILATPDSDAPSLERLERKLLGALASAGLDEAHCPDMLAVVTRGGDETERELACRADAILTAHPLSGPFDDLPPFDAKASWLRPASARSLSAGFLPVNWLDGCTPALQFVAGEAGTTVSPNIDGLAVTADVVLPPVCLYALTNVTVVAISSAFVSERSVIFERVPGVDEARCVFEGGHVVAHGRHYAHAVRPLDVTSIENGFFLSGYGYWNYYHWMIELLPKLQHWHRLSPELRAYPLLVGERVRDHTSLLEALELFCEGAEVRVLNEGVAYTVGHLLHINAPNTCPFNLRVGDNSRVTDFLIRSDTIHDWRERVGLGPRRSSAGGRRLFLARGGDRRSYNQAEVLDVFTREGFEAVYLERMSLREQIDAMSSAEMLAGPSGAAWTNLIFCTRGAKAICWMPEQAEDFSAFSTIASIVGVDLRYLTYPTTARSTAELFSANYRLEATEVKRALAGLVAETRGSDLR